VHVKVYARVRVCMPVSMFVCVCVYACECLFSVCVYVCLCVCACLFVFVCVLVFVRVCVVKLHPKKTSGGSTSWFQSAQTLAQRSALYWSYLAPKSKTLYEVSIEKGM